MSGKFVRASSFRHAFGTAAKPDNQYLGIKVSCNGDGAYIAGNSKFIAYASVGGGGPVMVTPVDQVGRAKLTAPKLAVHKAKVLDFAFNPFNDNLLATASEDCYIKLSEIPDGGLTENLTTPLVSFEGHEKKVTQVKWHPTANNVLASASADHTVKVWDATSGQEKFSYDGCADTVHNITWNRDGSQIAAISKDKFIHIFDPRDSKVVTKLPTHEGSKKSSVFFMKYGLIGTVGFTRSSLRQIHIWDPSKPDKPIAVTDIDQSAGVFNTFYDYDTSVLFLAGKGDSSIKYYEITAEAPYIHFLSAYSDTSSQKGICWLPKLACNIGGCEIAKCYRLMRDSVVPVGFTVPRKNTLFQKDLFPDGYAGSPAQEGAAYFEGKNADPVITSMKPGQQVRAASGFAAKKSYDVLEAELAAATKKIAELEAALAAK